MTAPLPPLFAPMLPTLVSEPFDSAEHLFEIKWDGVRILAFCNDHGTRLFSRSGREVNRQYPEFSDLHRRLKVANAVLDGEIVALDSDSRPSFERLQQRINLSRDSDVARGVSRIPLDLVLFDLPFRDGVWLAGNPLVERMEQLGTTVSFEDRILKSEPIPEHGKALFEAARARGLEGVVGKRAASHYVPGKRTRDWLKVKTTREIDCVIGGFSAGQNARAGTFGALLVGVYDGGALRYIGSVGTGYTLRTLGTLKAVLDSLATTASPFSEPIPIRQVIWVRPALVCEVEFRELTHGLRLRAPAFKRLRDDKLPEECTLDQLVPQPV
jgi:bifunctional non-homologous end joining protein LigD